MRASPTAPPRTRLQSTVSSDRSKVRPTPPSRKRQLSNSDEKSSSMTQGPRAPGASRLLHRADDVLFGRHQLGMDRLLHATQPGQKDRLMLVDGNTDRLRLLR